MRYLAALLLWSCTPAPQPCAIGTGSAEWLLSTEQPMQATITVPGRVEIPALTGFVLGRSDVPTTLRVTDCAGRTLLEEPLDDEEVLYNFWTNDFIDGCESVSCDVTACFSLSSSSPELAEVTIDVLLHDHAGTCPQEQILTVALAEPEG